MDKIELIQKIEEATGIEYHAEDFKSVKDIIWNYYIDSEMFTENEIQIATGLTGYNEETLNDILFIVYGYRDLIQYLESEVLYESTLNENRHILTPEEYEYIMSELGRDEVKNNDLMNRLRDYTNWKHEYDYDAYEFTTDEDKKIITDIIKREVNPNVIADYQRDFGELNESTIKFTNAFVEDGNLVLERWDKNKLTHFAVLENIEDELGWLNEDDFYHVQSGGHGWFDEYHYESAELFKTYEEYIESSIKQLLTYQEDYLENKTIKINVLK